MIRTAIIGAAGYSGAELTGLLAAHEAVELAGLFGSEARGGANGAASFGEIHPRWREIIELPVVPADLDALLALEAQAIFLATPHEVSHDLAPALLDAGAVVFDLSAAFRLPDADLYTHHYGFAHSRADLLDIAVYGLPERHGEAIASASLIALPGCYPTSVILPLAPLAEAGAIDPGRPVIADCTSGVSGAGRSPSLRSMFCEVSQQPYGVLAHRHAPEIDVHGGTPVIFTPHLGPYDRGILSTIHIGLAPGWTALAARETLAAAYADEPFVRLLPGGQWPSVGAVRHTNFCDIALAADEQRRHLIVVSAIDNLLKGAGGQAVQCFNRRFGFPQTLGLPGAQPCTTAT